MPTRLIESKEVGKFKKYPGGIYRVYCLKTLKKPSICLQGITPSAPNVLDLLATVSQSTIHNFKVLIDSPYGGKEVLIQGVHCYGRVPRGTLRGVCLRKALQVLAKHTSR